MVISVIVHSASPGKGVRTSGVVVALGVNVRQGWMQPCAGSVQGERKEERAISGGEGELLQTSPLLLC